MLTEEKCCDLGSVGLQACRMLHVLSSSTDHATMIAVGIELYLSFLSAFPQNV